MVFTEQQQKAIYKWLTGDKMCCPKGPCTWKLTELAAEQNIAWTENLCEQGSKFVCSMKKTLAVNEAEDCTDMDNPHRVMKTETAKRPSSQSLTYISSNTIHFLAAWSLCHYLWSRSTIRLAQTLPTVQSSSKLAHEFVFIVCVIFPFGIWPS